MSRIVHLTTFEAELAARILWAEARSEPDKGQAAVVHVMLERVRDPRWPDTLAGVLAQPRQFSCLDDRQRQPLFALPLTDPVLRRCLAVVWACAADWWKDPAGGANHYFNPAAASPAWHRPDLVTLRSGRHVFERH